MKNPLVITLLFIMTCYSCNNTVKDQKVMQELDVAVINQVTVTDYLSSGYWLRHGTDRAGRGIAQQRTGTSRG